MPDRGAHASPPVAFSILGCGVMGERHAEVLHHLPGAALGSAYDPDEGRLAAFCERWECRPAASPEDAAGDAAVEAVLVAAPTFLHASLALLAAEAGKHVLLEKPISTDLASGREVVSRCAEAGVVLSVVSQKRFGPGARQLRAAVEEGLLGRIFMAEVSINYFRDENYFREAPWRASRAESGGGVLMNQGIHYADLLLWYLGPFAEVRGVMTTVRPDYQEEDVALALVEFESGALASLTASTITYPGFPETITLYGTEGSCTLVEGKDIVRWDQRGGLAPPELPPEPPLPEALPGKLLPMGRLHVDFLSAVREGRAPLVSPEEALAVVSLMERLYERARSASAEAP